jgi:hypothetical protein
MKIITEQRSRDWIAFIDGHREIWEAGKTEVEAAGKLVVRINAGSAENEKCEKAGCGEARTCLHYCHKHHQEICAH